MDTQRTITDLLIPLFRDILNLEGKAVITEEFKDISNNDMRILEAIGSHTQKNMSAIAKELSITVGTLTIAMNNLVKKGYVKRSRSQQDRRVVLISLTERGERAFCHHKQFHEEMIAATLQGISPEDSAVLIHALTNLSEFLKHYPHADL
ncbi:MAG: MarR family winged helix-turn-helix transcriptional regulator [Lachnospiraceae bacterium]